jgi:hypothetical protein
MVTSQHAAVPTPLVALNATEREELRYARIDRLRDLSRRAGKRIDEEKLGTRTDEQIERTIEKLERQLRIIELMGGRDAMSSERWEKVNSLTSELQIEAISKLEALAAAEATTGPQPSSGPTEERIVRGGYTKIPNEIFDYSHLSTGEKMLYMALWRYCWQDNQPGCPVNFDMLAHDLCVTERTIENYLYGIAGKPGLIHKTPYPNVPADPTHKPLVSVERMSNKTNIYTLNYKPATVRESSGAEKRSNVTRFPRRGRR